MNDAFKILIVDDEEDYCEIVADILRREGYETFVKNNPVEALDFLRVQTVDLVLLDVLMPQMDGREVLTQIVQNWPEIPVTIITGQAYDVPVAIETAKKGSFHFLKKPLDRTILIESVRQALSMRRPTIDNSRLEEAKKELGIVFASPQIREVLAKAEKVAQTLVPVLITGESGVGKEVLARAIHYLSPRREKPFVSLDCGTLSETLLESELFGHVKGSFTGASSDKRGLFESADGGTIFLDEITNTSMTFQQKLLYVLNNSKVRRVGDTRERDVNVRVISATNKDIVKVMRAGEFREDLYYRLNKYDISIPPLRERKEDITVLARHLLSKACAIHELRTHVFTPAALDLLQKQAWKGNVRELDSVVTKLAIFAEAEEIDVHTVATALEVVDTSGQVYMLDERPLMDQVEEFEKNLIVEALRANGGNQTKAAQQLGVERTNFVKKMKKHGLLGMDFTN